jgi:hypothetical protein
MRVMVMTKGDAADEGKGEPTTEMFEKMRVFNEQLVNAGIMLGGEGLKPSSAGAKIAFSTSGTSVVDGPFTESKEVIAGYWIWDVSSLAEAVEWAKRCPFDPAYGDSQGPGDPAAVRHGRLRPERRRRDPRPQRAAAGPHLGLSPTRGPA